MAVVAVDRLDAGALLLGRVGPVAGGLREVVEVDGRQRRRARAAEQLDGLGVGVVEVVAVRRHDEPIAAQQVEQLARDVPGAAVVGQLEHVDVHRRGAELLGQSGERVDHHPRVGVAAEQEALALDLEQHGDARSVGGGPITAQLRDRRSPLARLAPLRRGGLVRRVVAAALLEACRDARAVARREAGLGHRRRPVLAQHLQLDRSGRQHRQLRATRQIDVAVEVAGHGLAGGDRVPGPRREQAGEELALQCAPVAVAGGGARPPLRHRRPPRPAASR